MKPYTSDTHGRINRKLPSFFGKIARQNNLYKYEGNINEILN